MFSDLTFIATSKRIILRKGVTTRQKVYHCKKIRKKEKLLICISLRIYLLIVD